MIRFFSDEIQAVFGTIFNMERYDNKMYFRSNHFDNVIANIPNVTVYLESNFNKNLTLIVSKIYC